MLSEQIIILDIIFRTFNFLLFFLSLLFFISFKIFILFLRLFLYFLLFFPQKPLFSCNFNLSLFFLNFFKFVFCIKFFLPSSKRLNSNRCKCGKFRLLKYFLLFLSKFIFILHISFSFDQILWNPRSGFFDYIINKRSIFITVNKIFNGICDGNHVIPGNTHDRLYLIFERSVGIVLSKFKH